VYSNDVNRTVGAVMMLTGQGVQ